MTRFTLNGETMETQTDPDTTLLWVLRDELKLTGTKFGCGAGMCGACTIHLDGAPTPSCQLTVADVDGAEVTTIEGLSAAGPHAVQRAWIAAQAPQCGYCQSGQIMRAAALLRDNPNPSRDDIVAEMSANLCRCGSYNQIVRAVQRAAREV